MGFPQNIEVFAFMDRVNFAGDAEDFARVILRAPNAPLAIIENSHCNAYPYDFVIIQGANGTLKGDTKSLSWKYFKPEEAPAMKLHTLTLKGENNTPIYCSENLKMYEENWNAPTGDSSDEVKEGLTYYRALYESLVNNADFPVKEEQLILQMKVIEKAFEQNKELFKNYAAYV